MMRTWDAERPVSILGTIGSLRRGSGDPANQIEPDGAFWRACTTPRGDVTLELKADRGVVTARAWGPGSSWALDRLPVMFGEQDDWSGVDVSEHPRLVQALRANPGTRLPSTGLIMDSLIPAILEQRVTGMEARRSWRGLLDRYGHRAPGPKLLQVPPTARELLNVPTWEWHKLGVDLQRQRAVRACATVAARLEECVDLEPDAALTRLQIVPGVGLWTAAETLQRAVGHPDAISVGDYHLANHVVYFFTGEPRGTDEQMLELLEPWAGQRQRVVRLIEQTGVGAPRFGPRYSPLNIRAM